MTAWHAVAAIAIVAICGINLVATARRVLPPPRAPAAIPTNVVLRHEQRMAEVTRALQRRAVHSPLGYLADIPSAELAASHHGMEDYFLTQFALVPWVLKTSPEDCDWIITNLATTTLAERIPAGFRVAENFGHGVWLLEKIRP